VERKSGEDPIFDERKVENDAIDNRFPIDSSNLDYKACLVYDVPSSVSNVKRIILISKLTVLFV